MSRQKFLLLYIFPLFGGVISFRGLLFMVLSDYGLKDRPTAEQRAPQAIAEICAG
jgi:hypothetical protein